MGEARELAERHYQAVNAHDVSAANDVHSDDVEAFVPGAGAFRGRDAFQEFSKPFFDAFPDASMHPTSWLETEDTVVVEGSFKGTHTEVLKSPAGDVPPTNRPLDLKFVDIFRAKDGRVVSHHVYFDRLDFAEQLGLAPPAEGTG